jgi:hypothetical protein
MAYSFWANVGVDVETAAGTPLVITGITKANPAVVTYTGTDPANGDVVKFDVAGMTQLHKRAGRVANVNAGANTFEIEDEDSTNYGTFASGTATPITLGVSMTTVQDVNSSGGEPEYKDISTIHDQIRREVPTVVSAFNLAFGCLWDMTDAAHQELKQATLELTERVIRIRFSNGVVMLGNAYVSAAGVPTGSAQDVVKTNVAFTMQGLPTVLA